MNLAIRDHQPLAPLTTLGIGGPARYFAVASSPEEMEEGITWARDRNVPLLILGGGSNLLIADTGYPGLVLQNAIAGFAPSEQEGHVRLTAGAGEEWDQVVARAVEAGWSGIECLSGIPGRVGATPIQNVGAYGQEVSETIVAVEVYDIAAHRRLTLSNPDCGFAYRDSVFKNAARGRYAVLAVTYELGTAAAEVSVHYAELQRYLAEHDVEALGAQALNVAAVRDAVLTIRKRKAMVVDPTDPDSRSAGSFFVNPVVTHAELARINERITARLAERARVAGHTTEERSLPAYPAGDNLVKLSAAWLIEHAGFHKGEVRGRVGLSAKHVLAIINRGGATAREVLDLAEEIREKVFACYGVTLTPEPVLAGFE